MNNVNILKKYPGKDSLTNYRQIFEHYGYVLEDFDKTINYYSDHPDKFELLYEKILNKMSEMESEIKSSDAIDAGPLNLWNQKLKWGLPEDGAQNKIPFSIRISKQGTYTLSVRVKMYPDDQSEGPIVSAWFWYDNGTADGVRIPFLESKILKNGQWNMHSLSKLLTDSHVTHIKGNILDHSNLNGSWTKHAEVEDISIRLFN